MEPFPYRRIAVVGTTGSGKSTLAANIAHRLHIPHIELDALHWKPNWSETSRAEMRARIEAITRNPAWVTDGNYTYLQDILLPRAQAVVWLDYPLPLILWRLWWRTLRRVVTREFLWGTNYEKLWPQFFSRDSIFLWALKTYRRRKEQYAMLTTRPENAHLKVFHLKSPHVTEEWFQTI